MHDERRLAGNARPARPILRPRQLAPPPAPGPRLAAELLSAAGELVIVAACILGFVTAGSWLITGADLHSRTTRQPPPAQVWRCWWDRRYGREICEPPYRQPPMRRYFMRDQA
jgi:hypothetical protein